MSRHPPFLRIVPAASSSSIDKGTFRLRAQRKSLECHLPGMPVDGQLRTVESGIFNSSETGFAPPKRSRISEGSGEVVQFIAPTYPFNGSDASPFFGARPEIGNKTKKAHNSGMTKVKRIRRSVPGAPGDEHVLKQQMAGNVKAVRAAFDCSAQEMADRLGIPKSTYGKYEAAVSWLPFDILVTLANQGASLEFLVWGIGSPLRERPETKTSRSRAKSSFDSDQISATVK